MTPVEQLQQAFTDFITPLAERPDLRGLLIVADLSPSPDSPSNTPDYRILWLRVVPDDTEPPENVDAVILRLMDATRVVVGQLLKQRHQHAPSNPQ